MKNRTQKIVLGIIKTLGIIVNDEFMTSRLFSYLYAVALARKGEILFYFNHSIADTDMSLNILRRLRCRL